MNKTGPSMPWGAHNIKQTLAHSELAVEFRSLYGSAEVAIESE